MKVLLIEPGKTPVPIHIDNTLEAMQSVVDGLIEAIYPFHEPVALICNEEGKLSTLPVNRLLRDPDTDMVYDVVVGTCFLCSAPPNSEHFESLTDTQIQYYTALFNAPEFSPSFLFTTEGW